MGRQLELGLPSAPAKREPVALTEGAWLLPSFALDVEAELCAAVKQIPEHAPFQHMTTPGGYHMSVAMTNCGDYGWVSDAAGYRYASRDPNTGRRWPALPRVFTQLAERAANAAGFPHFAPDACLVNRYAPGARLTLHQDKNELDLTAPIVSVSLGLPCVFLFGGATRNTRPQRLGLSHADVVVWGGPSRLNYHGVLPLPDGEHPWFGAFRINLTLRKTGLPAPS